MFKKYASKNYTEKCIDVCQRVQRVSACMYEKFYNSITGLSIGLKFFTEIEQLGASVLLNLCKNRNALIAFMRYDIFWKNAGCQQSQFFFVPTSKNIIQLLFHVTGGETTK